MRLRQLVDATDVCSLAAMIVVIAVVVQYLALEIE